MKILILGHGRHGKDTVAEILREQCGMKFLSSSWAAAEKAVFPTLSEIYGYETVEECYADRANHRMEWKHLITEYNTPDKGRLCKEILEKADCYVGMRCPLEFAAVRPLFGLVVWVDASERLPPDPSMDIPYNANTMYRVLNDGSMEELWVNLRPLVQFVKGEFK